MITQNRNDPYFLVVSSELYKQLLKIRSVNQVGVNLLIDGHFHKGKHSYKIKVVKDQMKNSEF